jgi:hypothetical protein
LRISNITPTLVDNDVDGDHVNAETLIGNRHAVKEELEITPSAAPRV